MSQGGYQTCGGWVPNGGLTAKNLIPNHLVVFQDQYGQNVYPGPNSGQIFADNPLEIDGTDTNGQSLDTVGEIGAPSFSFANPSVNLPQTMPGEFSLYLGPVTEPDAANRVLYLGDNPVNTVGIQANPAQENAVMLFKDPEGHYAYPGDGAETQSTLNATVTVSGTVTTPAVCLETQSAEPTGTNPVWTDGTTPYFKATSIVTAATSQPPYVAFFKDAQGEQIYAGEDNVEAVGYVSQSTQVQGTTATNALGLVGQSTEPVMSETPLWVNASNGILAYGTNPVVTSTQAETNYIAVFNSPDGHQIYDAQGQAQVICPTSVNVEGMTTTNYYESSS